MSERRELQLIYPPPPVEQRQVAPSQIIGTGIFILTEVMFFAGLISAFSVVKAGAPGGIWPPPGQPRLPVETTLFNTALLLLSAAAMWYAGRKFAENSQLAKRPYQVAMILGTAFVSLQGFEWVRLLADGLTLTSSSYGAFFYLIVGAHGLHVVGGVAALYYVYRLLRDGLLSRHTLIAMQMFWYFVVGLWPVLYWLVYLS